MHQMSLGIRVHSAKIAGGGRTHRIKFQPFKDRRTSTTTPPTSLIASGFSPNTHKRSPTGTAGLVLDLLPVPGVLGCLCFQAQNKSHLV